MGAIGFAWIVGLAFYALAWACPNPVLAVLGYAFAGWFFIASFIAAWHRARD